MSRIVLTSVLTVLLSTSASLAEIIVHAAGWEQPVLYFEDDGIVPAQMMFGFDGFLYVGNDKVDTPLSIYQVTAPMTGGPYGDPIGDPDTVLPVADGSVFVGGSQDVWRIPPGPGAPELIIDGLFDLPPQPGHMTLAPNGDMLANNNNEIVRFNLDGTLTTVVANVPTARGIGFGSDGFLYFVDENRTGISRLLYDAGQIPYDGSDFDPFITGFESINSISLMDDGTIIFSELLADEIYFGQLDGTTELFATVPEIGGEPKNHGFSAIQGPDGAIYLSDGTEGEEAIFRIVPEPATLSVLALGALAVIRRRR